MQKKYFIGIDVSKHTLDVAVIVHQSAGFAQPAWKQFSNTQKGLQEIKMWLTQMHILLSADTVVVIENTGIYHRLLWQYFSRLHIDVCAHAAQVKWSLGIARGKNDKVDSRRLALYAVRHCDRLKPTPPLHCGIMYLKDLMMLRSRIIVQTNSLKTTYKELKLVSIAATEATAMKKMLQPALDGLEQSLKKVEKT